MLVNEIMQITAHDWNVVHSYKRFVAFTVHSSHALLESKRHSAAIAIASDAVLSWDAFVRCWI